MKAERGWESDKSGRAAQWVARFFWRCSKPCSPAARSLKDLLMIQERIIEAGADFKSLTETMDTSTPAGRMVFQLLGAFAEFERELIRERTRVGLHAAMERGSKPEQAVIVERCNTRP